MTADNITCSVATCLLVVDIILTLSYIVNIVSISKRVLWHITSAGRHLQQTESAMDAEAEYSCHNSAVKSYNSCWMMAVTANYDKQINVKTTHEQTSANQSNLLIHNNDEYWS